MDLGLAARLTTDLAARGSVREQLGTVPGQAAAQVALGLGVLLQHAANQAEVLPPASGLMD